MFVKIFCRGFFGGYFVVVVLKIVGKGMLWYNNELVFMVKEIGYRLLLVFNIFIGIFYFRVSVLIIFIFIYMYFIGNR